MPKIVTREDAEFLAKSPTPAVAALARAHLELLDKVNECKWCPSVPVNEFGNHIIKRYYGTGDAAIPCPHFAVKERDELRSQNVSQREEYDAREEGWRSQKAALESQLAEAHIKEIILQELEGEPIPDDRQILTGRLSGALRKAIDAAASLRAKPTVD